MAESVRGKFLWHELMTSDTASAGDFYGKVVGWKVKAWEQDPSYKMWMTGKRSMGGLMPQRVEPGQKSPQQWFTYIGTPDVDATVRRAVELGGRVMRPAWDIPNVGRIAFLQDPQSAVFAVIRPSSPPPPGEQKRSLGDFSWHELITTNWQAAWDFYQKLFGWEKTSAMEMGPGQTYQMFGVDKVPVGGMYTNPPDQPGPPSWLPYAIVRDARRTPDVIKQAGGTVLTGPMEVPPGDWIVVGLDREGVTFAVHSYNPVAAAKPPLPEKVARAAKPAVRRVVKKLRPAKKSAKKSIKSKPAKKAKPVRKSAKKAKRRR